MLRHVQVLTQADKDLGWDQDVLASQMAGEIAVLLLVGGHPNIIRVLDVVTIDQGNAYAGYSMPIVEGLGTVWNLFDMCAPLMCQSLAWQSGCGWASDITVCCPAGSLP